MSTTTATLYSQIAPANFLQSILQDASTVTVSGQDTTVTQTFVQMSTSTLGSDAHLEISLTHLFFFPSEATMTTTAPPPDAQFITTTEQHTTTIQQAEGSPITTTITETSTTVCEFEFETGTSNGLSPTLTNSILSPSAAFTTTTTATDSAPEASTVLQTTTVTSTVPENSNSVGFTVTEVSTSKFYYKIARCNSID